ncbi:MAG: hypothetical protein K6A35_05720 [bacterium]|nr:hypothetical protein [bacterium]
MLRRFLSLMGEVGSLDELAQRLDTTPESVVNMLHVLERGGYVSKGDSDNVTGFCNPKACSLCPYHNRCRQKSTLNIWRLTPKGMIAKDKDDRDSAGESGEELK